MAHGTEQPHVPPSVTDPTSCAAVRYRWRLIRAGGFRLDAGSMFGLVPRGIWSKMVPTDDRGRMTVSHNCLLLERIDPPPPPPTSPSSSVLRPTPWSPRLVVIEAGTGDKMDPKSKDIFALEDRTIETALHEAGCAAADIDAVFVTHLHFDHAGGLTRLSRADETPDWSGAGAGGDVRVKVTFPHARVVTQAREWSDALANRSVMTRTYFRDHLEPIAEKLLLADSPRPFATGYIPSRDEPPALPVSLRRTEVCPGISVLLAPGHTWGQQAILFRDEAGDTVVFTPDVLPTAAHLGAACSLAYDVEPYTSMVTKRWFLHAAADQRWKLVLDHEPGHAVFRVRHNDKGWFDLENA